MNSFFRKILLICYCCLFYFNTNAQVNFYTDVSSNELNIQGQLTFRIVFENAENIQRITPPLFRDFIVLRGPSQEEGEFTIKGNKLKYQGFVYTLKPRKAGKLRIEAAQSIIAGKNYKSSDIIIVVKKDASPSNNQVNPYISYEPSLPQPSADNVSDYVFRKGDNVKEKVSKNMQLKLEVSSSSCYVGQPVIAAYKLYTRMKGDVRLSQNPSFNGFSVVDMRQPGFTDFAKQVVNGKEYNVYTIRRAQIYPLQPGAISVEPAEIENEVKFIKEEYAKQVINPREMLDAFIGSFFPPEAMVTQAITLSSEPVTINVKPLPENKPASFNGAVGVFEINASLQKPLFSTDEAGKLTVTITGNGNMQLLTAPDIQWPKGIESFDPKFSDRLSRTTVPVSGEKKFEYAFAANDSGHYELPAIHFSYFDPATATYKEIATAPIQFQVTKGKGNPVALSLPGKQYEKPSFINRVFYHRWWIIIFIGVVILTGIIIWLLKDKRESANAAPKPVVSQTNDAIDEIIEAGTLNQQNPFAESEKCLYADDCYGFYSLLNTELKKYLSVKFSIDANAVNSNSITAAMDMKGISNDIVLRLQSIMRDVEWQLYTPFERNEKMNELYQEAHEIVQVINTQSVRHL